MIDSRSIRVFQKTVTDFYQKHGRHDLPWRKPESDGSFDGYKILVSELMLQQTQVSRVIPKFEAFTHQFPDVAVLAAAPLGDVLRAWSGLGYNRRAKFLHQSANMIHQTYGDVLPRDLAALVKLPGVGHNTAAAVLAYAYDQPVGFIETNIRTVYIHHFFSDQTDVTDKDILVLVTASLPDKNIREWYWALMDYGSSLKQTVGNLNRASKSYTKQSIFEGSGRQVRGRIIHLLGIGPQSQDQLRDKLADDRVDTVLQQLLQEGLIQQNGNHYHL